MSRFVLLVVLGSLIISCEKSRKQKKHKSFTNFDLSYSDGLTSFFSIKFTAGNRVFVKEHFTQLQVGIEIPVIDESYYSFITSSDRLKLDSLIGEIDFSSIDSSYYQPATNIQYQLFIERKRTEKLIYIHSNNAPSRLASLSKWIVNLKSSLRLITTDSTVNFGSLVSFLPPPVHRPTINIIDPKMY